jgi:hypothetical protein
MYTHFAKYMLNPCLCLPVSLYSKKPEIATK